MTRLAKDPSPLIEKFYQAALEPSLWESTLRGIREYTSMEGIVFSCCDIAEIEKERPTLLVDLDPSGWDEYCREYSGICPRIKYVYENSPQHVFYDYIHTEESEIRSSDYYELLKRVWGTRYYTGLMFQISTHIQGHLGVHRPISSGHSQPEDLFFMELIRPHMHRALQLSYHLTFANGPGTVRNLSSTGKRQGLVLLNKHGVLLYMDEYAENLVNANDGLYVSEQRLRAAFSFDDTKLNRVINAVAKGEKHRKHGAGGALTVGRPSNKRSFNVLVSPLPSDSGQSLFGSKIAIFISNPEQCPSQQTAHLEQLFGLTPKEALLLSKFVEHTSLVIAAEHLGIAKNTARQHLKSIFYKTETSSQAELIKLVLSS